MESCDMSTGVMRLSADSRCKRSRACCSTAITKASWTALPSSPAAKKYKTNRISFQIMQKREETEKIKNNSIRQWQERSDQIDVCDCASSGEFGAIAIRLFSGSNSYRPHLHTQKK